MKLRLHLCAFLSALLAAACAPEPPAAGEAAETPASEAIESRNKTLFRTVAAELFGDKDVSAIDRYYAPDYVNHDPARAEMAREAGLSHREATKAFFAGFFEAFPDVELEIQHLYAEDDTVFAFTTYRGTHLGEFMGVPATGQPVVIRTAEIFRISDGLFAEHWDVVDDKGMAVIFAPAGAAEGGEQP